MKKIIKLIYWLVLTIVVVVAGLSAMSVLGIPQGLRTFVVQSGSMEPAIKTGSLVFVKPQSDYQVSDIITAKLDTNSDIKNPATTVTHRITDINTDDGNISYVTKGDANQSPDMNPRPKDMVIGKVILTLPYLGFPVGFAKTQTGFIIMIVIPATIIIYGELLKIKGEIVAIIKNKKNSKLKSKDKLKTLLLILSLLFLSHKSMFTNAYFSSQATISGNTFSAGIWVDDLIVDPAFSPTGFNLDSLIPSDSLFTNQFLIEEPTANPITIDTSFKRSSNELSINFNNIPVNFGNHYLDYLEYEITYYSTKIQKGIAGKILPDKVQIPSYQYQVTHFLGTCTSFGEVCLPDTIDDNTITVHLTGLVNNWPVSIIKVENL